MNVLVMKGKDIPTTVEAYIAQFGEPQKSLLLQLRSIIRREVPDAEEKISYGMPAFVWHGNLVYYAAYAGHIGFYPGAAILHAFASELNDYHTSKGTIQFSLDRKLPVSLIRKITAFRVKQNEEKAASKVAKKKPAKAAGADPFLMLSAPAQRALKAKHINTLKKLAQYTEKEILSLHGIGPTAIPKLKKALQDAGMAFKKG